MSDNYKVIRRAKVAFLELLHVEKWSMNQVVKTVGITHTMVSEICDQDPVGIKIREVSIEKLRKFVDKYDKGIDKPIRKGSVRTARLVDEFPTNVTPSMQESIPKDRGIREAPGADKGSGNDLMDQLNTLGSKFKMKGWNLEAKLSKIFIP